MAKKQLPWKRSKARKVEGAKYGLCLVGKQYWIHGHNVPRDLALDAGFRLSPNYLGYYIPESELGFDGEWLPEWLCASSLEPVVNEGISKYLAENYGSSGICPELDRSGNMCEDHKRILKHRARKSGVAIDIVAQRAALDCVIPEESVNGLLEALESEMLSSGVVVNQRRIAVGPMNKEIKGLKTRSSVRKEEKSLDELPF